MVFEDNYTKTRILMLSINRIESPMKVNPTPLAMVNDPAATVIMLRLRGR